MRHSERQCSAPSSVASSYEAAAAWLTRLFREYGPGEFILLLKADGRLIVRRPQQPLRFEWEPPQNARPG